MSTTPTGSAMTTTPTGTAAATPTWAPSTDQVAGFVARLAASVDGVTPGVAAFTDTTIPTAAQVASIVAALAQEVAHLAGDDLAQVWAGDPDRAGARAAARVVALGAASQVALSFYPGGTSADLAATLETRYLAALARLLPGVAGADEGAGSGGGAGGVDQTPATATGGFPLPTYDWTQVAW